uniref:Uncharacterized protein n=1 Tax=Babesia bovis TaxID=5865 RepID=S6BGU5_BABBO|nr:hypothetical protein [Babesia bovis]
MASDKRSFFTKMLIILRYIVLRSLKRSDSWKTSFTRSPYKHSMLILATQSVRRSDIARKSMRSRPRRTT